MNLTVEIRSVADCEVLVAATPDLSVIIPCYNSSRTIKKCVESVLGAGLSNIEIIIIDDHSSDDTQGVLNTLHDQNGCIRYLRNSSNQGVSASRNRGLDASRGSWITFIDSDDEIIPAEFKRWWEICLNLEFDLYIALFRINGSVVPISCYNAGETRVIVP